MAHLDQDVNNETKTNGAEDLFSVDYPVMGTQEKAMKTTIKVLTEKKPLEGRTGVLVEESVTYSPDELTVVTRVDAGLYTKRIKFTANGVEKSDYDHAYKHRDTVNVPVGTMQELEAAIRDLSNKPKSCVIRGQLIDCYADLDKAGEVRRTHRSGWDEKDTSEWKTAFFVDVPRSWACIDIDGDKVYAKDGTFLANHEVIFPGSSQWTDATTAKEKATQVATWLVNTWMPSNFNHKDAVVQWSSSYGLDGRFERVKAHVWVRLTKPLGVDVLGEWAQLHLLGLKSPDGVPYFVDMTAEYGSEKVSAKGASRLDYRTVNTPTQPNYTATPWFTDAAGKKIPDMHADYRVIRVNGNGAFGYAVDSDRIVEEFETASKKKAKKQAKTIGKTAYNPGGAPVVDNSDAAAQLSFDDWSPKDKSDYELAKLLLTYMGRYVDDYKPWLRAGMAIKTRFPGQDGLDLWTQWSLTSETRSEHEVVSACESKWPTFATEGVQLQKFGYLVAMARECGMPHAESHSGIEGAEETEQSFFESDLVEIPGVGVASDATSYCIDLERDDKANAQRLYNAFGDRLRYISDADRWAVFMGGRWKALDKSKKGLPTGILTTMIGYVVDRIDNEGLLRARRVEKAVEAAALRDGVDAPKAKEKAKKAAAREIAAYQTWRATSHQPAPRHTAMLYHLAGMPGISTRSSDWDSDPLVIGTPKGIVDFRTKTVRAYTPNDLMLRCAKANFRPEQGPVIDAETQQLVFDLMGQASDTTLTDEAKARAEYLWKILAYCTTGETHREKFFMWHGSLGGNGKSTMSSVLLAILGDADDGGYGVTLNAATVLQGKEQAGGARTDLDKLEGARFAVVNDIEESPRTSLNTGFIKDATGVRGLARITCRGLYAAERTFAPQFKLLLICNTPPQFSADGGMTRRLEAISFGRSWHTGDPSNNPTGKPIADPYLLEKLTKKIDHIFTYLVHLAADLIANGFKMSVPASVMGFTTETSDDMNPLRAFIAECCQPGDERVQASRLLSAYKAWRRVNSGSRDYSPVSFASEMERLGYSKVDHRGSKLYLGLRIVEGRIPGDNFSTY